MDIEKANRTVAVDFDGVLHDHSGVWEGVSKINGPPVPGAIHWLVRLVEYARKKGYDVEVYSGRSRSWFGRRAMKKWLWLWLCIQAKSDTVAREVMAHLSFPKYKPLCVVMLDDRAYKFSGKFPRPDRLFGFEPWYKKQGGETSHDGDQDEAGDEQVP
jgi:hypothetical protein